MRIEPEKRLVKMDRNPDVLNISKATTVESGNLTVTSGDLVLPAGDLTQTGDQTITGDLDVTGDVAITGGPLTQTVQYATVADPGDDGTITPPADTPIFYCAVTTVAADDVRILGAPDHLGQQAIIHHAVDGGAFTMTNASGWKGGTTSDDVATFSEAEDVMICVAAGLDAVDWRWIADVGVVFA